MAKLSLLSFWQDFFLHMMMLIFNRHFLLHIINCLFVLMKKNFIEQLLISKMHINLSL